MSLTVGLLRLNHDELMYDDDQRKIHKVQIH